MLFLFFCSWLLQEEKKKGGARGIPDIYISSEGGGTQSMRTIALEHRMYFKSLKKTWKFVEQCWFRVIIIDWWLNVDKIYLSSTFPLFMLLINKVLWIYTCFCFKNISTYLTYKTLVVLFLFQMIKGDQLNGEI